MDYTFEFLILIYMIIGLMVAINFVSMEREKKSSEFGVGFLFGIFIIFFYHSFYCIKMMIIEKQKLHKKTIKSILCNFIL